MNYGSPSNFNWQGKEKADDISDFEELNPTITYRHLLSRNLGVKDPLRVIALCDSDAFYAGCEMVRLGLDEAIPLVVLQWDSIIAVNYSARKYGISRMDKLKDARKRCPGLKVVHVATYKEGEKEPGYWENVDTNTHKVSLDYYRRESLKIATKFKEKLPDCEIEKASIDEAFFDFTKVVRELILDRYPYLAEIPVDAPNGLDSPLPPAPSIHWDNIGCLIPINSPSPNDHGDGLEDPKNPLEEGHTNDDAGTSWHDVALSIAAELMGRARREVYVELGYSTSAGIGKNKFLAKLTASYKKPNGQSILRNAVIPHYLKPMPFQKIRFLGGKLGDALAKTYDAFTVGDLLTISLSNLQMKFGEDSGWIYEILRGIDKSQVKDKGSPLNKSMLASKNLPQPITKASEGYHWIRVLAAELALRLNDARVVSPNLWPKSIVLHTRKGYETGRSKQAPFPFTRHVTVDTISSAGDKLWKELIGASTTTNISSVQLAFTGLSAAETGQRTIEGFLRSGAPTAKRQREDQEQNIYHDRPARARSSEISRDAVVVMQPGKDININMDNHFVSVSVPDLTCSRCGKTLNIPEGKSQSNKMQQELLLTALRVEHEDFHFAEDLSIEQEKAMRITAGTRPSGKQHRSSSDRATQGIKKFFSPK